MVRLAIIGSHNLMDNIIMKKPFTKDIQTKLDRMPAIQSILDLEREEYDETTESLFAEYRALQDHLVPVFLPVVSTLAAAGLWTLDVDLEGVENIEQYSHVTGEPKAVFDNGNISISGVIAEGASRSRTVHRPSK